MSDGLLQAFSAQAKFQTDIQLPTRLNGVPHERSVRKFFYKDATAAIQAAVDAGERRIQTRSAVNYSSGSAKLALIHQQYCCCNSPRHAYMFCEAKCLGSKITKYFEQICFSTFLA